MDAANVGEKQTDQETGTKEQGRQKTFASLVNIFATSEKYDVKSS